MGAKLRSAIEVVVAVGVDLEAGEVESVTIRSLRVSK
jgi:hypothetical protein